jgi:hypothetical protein
MSIKNDIPFSLLNYVKLKPINLEDV